MNAPMYIAEIAPNSIRGKMVTYYQLAIVVGFFSVFLATYFIGNDLSQSENISFGWRRMFWSELIPSTLFLILLFFVPKSPRWLAIKGKHDEALEVLIKLQGVESAHQDMQEIKSSLQSRLDFSHAGTSVHAPPSILGKALTNPTPIKWKLFF